MFYFVFIFTTLLIDYTIKQHIVKNCNFSTCKSILGGLFSIRLYHNKGAILNIFKSSPRIPLFSSIVVLIIMLLDFFKNLKKNPGSPANISYSLIIAGGLGNLYDRIKRGYVVDYLSFNKAPGQPDKLVFNLADVLVIIGIVILFPYKLLKNN